MNLLHRLSLVVFVLVAPPLLTAVFYIGSKYLLQATRRAIAPEVLWYAAAIEFAIFFFMAVLEARSRWNTQD
jgi:hypothetical protein